MKIAILEPDLVELDRALETLSASGHLCFGALCDERFRRLLNEVSADLFLLDWTRPDDNRYRTLDYLVQHAPTIPVVLYVSSKTGSDVINSGLKRGASFSIKKPCRKAGSSPLQTLSHAKHLLH